MNKFVLAFGLLLVFTFLPIVANENAAEKTPEKNTPVAKIEQAKKILDEVAVEENDPVWEYIIDLAALGERDENETYPAELAEFVAEAAPAQKVVIGGALLALGEQKDGTLLLEAIVTDEKLTLARRLDAAAVLGAYGGEYTNNRLRFLLKDEKLPEILRVELAKSLWELAFDVNAKETLKNIAFNGKNKRASIEATLMLGRIGQYETNKADDDLRLALRALTEFPGDIGAQAKMWQKLDTQRQQKVTSDKFTNDLLLEVINKIRTRYALDPDDAEEVENAKPEKIATNAARALVRSLDDFSDYLDAEDFQEMQNSMHNEYGGIGAYVGMRNGAFTILTPMWEKPAHKAGLQALDIISKIDDVDITKMPLDKAIKKLKGAPGTMVKLHVIRKGWEEPHDVTIKREAVAIPMMFSQMLPGSIGYIRLTGFNEDPARRISTASELKRALTEFKKQKVAGIILDLRNNPGGLLTEAVAVCENFLARNQVIVSSKGTFQPRRSYLSKVVGEPTYTGPLVVLTNGGSASASEIVAGALRDHKRATLVGEKTFGKGSVQMLLPMETAEDARLKLTIAKYYLPSGECIHGRDKGIKPHIEVEETKLIGADRELRIKQIENRDIDVWLEENFDQHKKEFMALLQYDDNDPQKYPKFDELYQLLTEKYPKIKLDKDIVRRELRSALFLFLRENRGIEGYPVDLMASDALKRGIVAIGEKIGGLPDIAVYNAFKDQWREEEAKKAAEAAKVATEKTAEAAVEAAKDNEKVPEKKANKEEIID